MTRIVTSYIPTTTVKRARVTDALTWPLAIVPQAMTVYLKFKESGTVLHVDTTVFAIADTMASTVRPRLNINANGTVYAINHEPTLTNTVASAAAAGPKIGDIVELRGVLTAAGKVQLGQTINGAAEVVAALSSAPSGRGLEQHWGGAKLFPYGATITQEGAVRIIAIYVVRGVQTLAAMRRFAGTGV